MSKKYFGRTIAIAILVFLFYSTFFCPFAGTMQDQSAGEEEKQRKAYYELQIGEIAEYCLGKENFQRFLQNPTMDVFLEEYNDCIVYRKSAVQENYIEVLNDDGSVFEEVQGGQYRIGAWPIYTEFIDFMNERNNFEQALQKNGIEEQLLNYTILSYDWYEPQEGVYIPPGTGPQMCIWLHTKEGDYFLENDVYHGDPFSTDFDYVFYGLKQYQAIFKQRSSTGY